MAGTALAGAISARAHAAGVRGLNLTLPLKEVALRCVARATDECTRTGAANTLVRRPDGSEHLVLRQARITVKPTGLLASWGSSIAPKAPEDFIILPLVLVIPLLQNL